MGTLKKGREAVLTKEVTIAPEKKVRYHIDGEIRFGGENLSAKIEPRALTLKVPHVYTI
jgi:diacylglycerol kinase family enzyme